MRKTLTTFAAGAVVAAFAGLSGAANAATELTLSSWLPPSHPIVADMIVPWIKQVEAATNGNVKINILPKPMGKPPAHFDLAKDGIADVTFGVHGYQPGRFVLTKAVEMPFLGDSAEATSVAYWRIHQKYFAAKNEHDGVTLLGVFTHGPGEIYNSRRAVNSMDDLNGLKIRVGGGVVNDVSQAIGVTPLLKPASESHEILANGVADGVFFPKESIKSFKLTKLVKYATFVPGGLYNTSFFLVMNPGKFAALSKADQAAMMKVSGENFAHIAGKGWDAADKAGVEAMKADGIEIATANQAFVDQVRKATAKIEAQWIAEVTALGVDGVQVMKDLRAEIAKAQGGS